MSKLYKILVAGLFCFISACASQKETAEPAKYAEPRFNQNAPIELLVSKIDIISEFTPSFTRPNVEHLFPISLERTARIWATDRLEAVDFGSQRTAQFIIKDASVTEREEKATELFHKDMLRYRATLNVVLKIVEANGASAQTSIEAWRELGIPVDTTIDQKEKYWNEMIQNLMADFNSRMHQNIEQYLNMYVKNSVSILEY